MTTKRLVFRTHAIRRMFQRRISPQEIRHVLETGVIVRVPRRPSLSEPIGFGMAHNSASARRSG